MTREPAPKIARGSFLRASAPAEKKVVGEVLPLRDKRRERWLPRYAMPSPLLPFLGCLAHGMNAGATQRHLHRRSATCAGTCDDDVENGAHVTPAL